MSEEKVFYVNFETGSVASNADMVCNDISCDDCPYVRTNNCGDVYHKNPEKYMELCGYTAIPFSVLTNYVNDTGSVIEPTATEEKKRHHVFFPQASLPSVFMVDDKQFAVMKKLRSMGFCDFSETVIQEL